MVFKTKSVGPAQTSNHLSGHFATSIKKPQTAPPDNTHNRPGAHASEELWINIADTTGALTCPRQSEHTTKPARRLSLSTGCTES